MPVIYLKHPIHGAKVATMDLEVAGDLANGWKVFDPTVQAPVVAAPAPASAPVETTPIEQVNQLTVSRKGRPRKIQEG